MQTGTLIVHRKGGWADRLRSYRIFANGEEIGRIKRDRSFSVELPVGRIALEARIDWTRSEPLLFLMRADDTVDVEVANTHGALKAGWAITHGRDTYLTLRMAPSE